MHGRRQLLAYGRLAYRDHHGRQDEFSVPCLSSRPLSLSSFLRTVFLSIFLALILFFFSRPEQISFSLSFCGSTCTHTRSRTRNTLSVFWSLLPPSLPYLFPCPPYPVSVSGSNSGVSINLAITPRWISENGHVRHRGNGTRPAFVSLHTLPCIRGRRARVYVRGVGSVNTQQTRQTIGHQEWIRIKFVTSATTNPVYPPYINNLRSE